MIYLYAGNYPYSKQSVLNIAPSSIGVYYCGNLDWQGNLIPQYIGRAIGEGVSIRSRLLDHLNENGWFGVSHFGYRVCTTREEAKAQEIFDIRQYQPLYNTQWKSPVWKLLGNL